MKFEINTDKIVDNIVSEVLEKKIDGKTLKQWMVEIAKHQWISVKDRLPEEETEYLCWFGNFPMGAFARVCRWNKIRGAFWCYSDNAKWAFVTHWMPLPEPPKDGDGDER